MKVPRKLFRKDLLIELTEKAKLGVPVSKLVRDYKLDCSDPHLSKHVDYYTMFNDKPEVINSLFPAWLNADEDMQEEDSNNWKYVGLFPWGEWITIEEWLSR